MIIKKLLFLLIILTTLTNVSYASFPLPSVVDTPVTDTTLNIETTEQYHLRIQKMGFDLSNCNCASCRKGIPPLVRNSKGDLVIVDNKNKSNGSVKGVLISAIVLTVIIAIWFINWLLRGVECVNNREACNDNSRIILGVPAEFFGMAVLSWVSVFLFIKACRMNRKLKQSR